MGEGKGLEPASTRLRAKARALANLLLLEAGGDALRALGLLALLRQDSHIHLTPQVGKEPRHEHSSAPDLHKLPSHGGEGRTNSSRY